MKLALLTAVAMLAFLGTGCSGINASQSVSPASFFLPGFGQTDPSPAPGQPTNQPEEFVQVLAKAK